MRDEMLEDPMGDPGADTEVATLDDPMGDPGATEVQAADSMTDPIGDPGSEEQQADPLGDPGADAQEQQVPESPYPELQRKSISDTVAQEESDMAAKQGWQGPNITPDAQAQQAVPRMGLGERAFASFSESFVPFGIAERDWQGEEPRSISEKVVQAAGSIGGFVGSMVGPSGWSRLATKAPGVESILSKITNPKARRIVENGVKSLAAFVTRDQLYMPPDAELGKRIDQMGNSALMATAFSAAGGLGEFGTLGKVAAYPALATLGASMAAESGDPLDAAIGAGSLVFLHALGETKNYMEARARTTQTMRDMGVDRQTAERLARMLAERREAIAEQEAAAQARLDDLKARAKAGDRTAFDELARERGVAQEPPAPVQMEPEARRQEGIVPARLGEQGEIIAPPVAPPAPGIPTSIIDMDATKFPLPEVTMVEMPLEDLVVQDRVKQFKRGANPNTGVVRGRELRGEYQRTPLQPIVAWERNDGKIEVITGRNRFDLARRNGEKTIPTQILREADGYTEEMARRLDVESNIRDEQGEVSDYAHFFRNYPELTREQAEAKGLVNRSKGQAGWTLGRDATDDLYSLFQAGRISEDKAVAIAKAAPGNAALQAAGIDFAGEKGVDARDVGNFVEDLAARASERKTAEYQGDMFGFDDSILKESRAIAKLASKKQNAIEQQLGVLRAGKKLGKGKIAEIAKQYGINVNDPAAIEKAMDALYAEAASWEQWRSDPEKMKMLRVELGLQKAEPEKVEIGEGFSIQPAGSGWELKTPEGGAVPLDPNDPQHGELLTKAGIVKETSAVYAGDLGAGSQGETGIRRTLRLAAESSKGGQVSATAQALATRALQQKARSLLDALDAGRINDRLAMERWQETQVQIARGQKKIENRPVVKPTEVDMFAPQGPAPGMLLEGKGEYLKPEFPLASQGEEAQSIRDSQGVFQFEATHDDLLKAAAARGVKPAEQAEAATDDRRRLEAVSGTTGGSYSSQQQDIPALDPQEPQPLLSPDEVRKAQNEALRNPFNAEYWAKAFSTGDTITSIIQERIKRPNLQGWNMRGQLVENPQQAAAIHMTVDAGTQEVFTAMYLDSRRRTIETRVITVGILNASLVHPREIYGNMPKGAMYVVTAHNHPSGDPTPSAEDVLLTRQLNTAAAVAGVRLLDHVVTNAGKYHSMKQNGIVTFDSPTPEWQPRVIPRSEFSETPEMPQQYDWEALPRSDLAGYINQPSEVNKLASAMSQHHAPGKFVYVIYLNTKNYLTAVTRLPAENMGINAAKEVAKNAGRHGAAAWVLAAPYQVNAEAIRATRTMIEASHVGGVKLLDVVMAPDFSSQGNTMEPYTSLRETGTIDFKVEEQSDPYNVREERAPYGGRDALALAQKISGEYVERAGDAAAASEFEQWYSGMAPLGDPKAPVNDPQWSVFPVELPEAVQLAKELLGGRYPKVLDALRGMHGMAAGMAKVHRGTMAGASIELRRDMFRLIPTDLMDSLKAVADDYARNNPGVESVAVVRERYLQSLIDGTVKQLLEERPAAASHVLWHEIGHIADHYPQGNLHQRGNIFGRIASLFKFTKDMLPFKDQDLSKILTKEERQDIRKKAQKQVGPMPPKDEEADLSAWRDEVRKVYQELLTDEAERRGLVRYQWMIDELEGLNMWWRGDTEMSEYTSKPQEMYANAFSAIMNNPEAVRQRAPTFYQAFFTWLDQKPTVKAVYDKIQADITLGQIQNERARTQMESMIEADAAGDRFQNAMMKRGPGEWRDIMGMIFDRRFNPMYRRIGQNPGAQSAMSTQKAIADWLYHQASNRLYLERMVAEVMRPLRQAGVSRAEFNVYLANQHILHNRYDIANPEGMDAKAAAEALEDQERRLGPEKWQAMQAADEARWKIRNEEVLDLPQLKTMIGDDLLAILKARRYYSTVSAVDTGKDPVSVMFDSRYGGQVGPRIYRQAGYLGSAKSPMLATSQKDVSLITSAYLNDVRRMTVAMLKEIGESNLRESEWTWDKNLNRRVPRIVENDRVKTLVYLEGGELRAYDIPSQLHDMIERSTPADSKAMIEVIHKTMRVIKGAWTDLNYGFWPFNYIRDTKGFAMNMPGVYSRIFGEHAYVRYRQRAAQAARSILDGNPNEIAKRAMKRNLIIVTREQISADEGLEAFDRFLKSHGIEPSWFDYADTSAGRKGLWRAYTDIGRRLEMEVKIAGMLHVDEHPKLAALPEAEKQRIVHELSGSPNFLEKGTWNWLADGILPFYNPAKQGYRQSWHAWKQDPYGKAYKMFKYAVLPKLVMAALLGSAGAMLMGKKRHEEYKAMWRSIGKYDKSNYDVIPLAWADRKTGKVLYWRGVEQEEERMIGGILAKLLAKDWNPQDLINYASGQLPGFNPFMSVGMANFQFWAAGINPTDRGRKIVDDTRFDAGKGGKEMAKWTANNLGAGLIVRFNSDNFYDPNPTMIERILNWPIISNLAGRFLKVSNRGYDELADRDIRRPAKQAAAKMRMEIQDMLENGIQSQRQIDMLDQDPGALDYYHQATKERNLRGSLDPYTREMLRMMHSPRKVRAFMEATP